MTCIIYRITCVPTAKHYIGLTSMRLKRRWDAHVWVATKKNIQGPLQAAIRKYGPGSFVIDVLETIESRAEANVRERHLITFHGTIAPNGYNVTAGGDGGATSTGRRWTEAQHKRMKEVLTGRKISPEIVERVAAQLRGRKNPAQAPIARAVGYRNKGKKRTPEDILAVSITRRELWLERCISENLTVGCQKSGPRFRAQITMNRQKHDLGSFDTMAEAQSAWLSAARAHLQELRSGNNTPRIRSDIKERRRLAMQKAWERPNSALRRAVRYHD